MTDPEREAIRAYVALAETLISTLLVVISADNMDQQGEALQKVGELLAEGPATRVPCEQFGTLEPMPLEFHVPRSQVN